LLSAERTADHVLARVVRRLFRRHASGAHFLFDDRVVFSFAMQLAVRCEPVKSRVAHVAESGDVTLDVERDDRRRHH
jgi:hypothetical protein